MKPVMETTVKHKVGACPACRDYLWAEVDIATLVGDPLLSVDGKPAVNARAEAVAMRLAHECRKRDDTP